MSNPNKKIYTAEAVDARQRAAFHNSLDYGSLPSPSEESEPDQNVYDQIVQSTLIPSEERVDDNYRMLAFAVLTRAWMDYLYPLWRKQGIDAPSDRITRKAHREAEEFLLHSPDDVNFWANMLGYTYRDVRRVTLIWAVNAELGMKMLMLWGKNRRQ